VFWVCREMDKRFIIEAKTFVFAVLDGESVLRVGEKRKNFSGEVILSFQCFEWLVSTMEWLLGSPEEQNFVKSFREGPKVLIARIGGNKAGCFLEATIFRMGGRDCT
jgi:hypothetical protein